MTIATVTAITGQAWARDADGNLRELSIGDTLQEGEVLVTADGARVELDFGDNLDPTVIQGGEEVAMTPQLSGEEAVAEDEASALDEDLEALLTAIDEGEGDLLAELDPTAAGAGPGGGAEGGHSFVMLARITEPLTPLSYEYGLGQFDQVEFPEDTFLDQAEEDSIPTVTTLDLDGDGDTVWESALEQGSGGGVATTSGAFQIDTGSDELALIEVQDAAGNWVAITASGADVQGTYGVLSVNPDGSWTYTLTQPLDHPLAGQTGASDQVPGEAFAVRVTDDDGDVSDPTTLAITITDDGPAAVADAVGEIAEDSSVTIDVFTNDTAGADGVDLTTGVAVATGPGKGSVVYNGDGTFTYTANAGAEGSDSFTYTITDADGDTSTATVTLSIAEDSTPTVATPDLDGDGDTVWESALTDGSGQGGAGITTTTGGTLQIDTGGDALALIEVQGADGTWVAISADGTQVSGDYGTLTVNTDGSWSYTLDDNTLDHATADAILGADQVQDLFGVRVSDDDGDVSPEATLTIDVNDDGPVASDDAVGEIAEDSSVEIDVFANDTAGADGVDLTTGVAVASGPGKGSVVYNDDGTFTYTANAGAEGSDSFTYTITDADGDTSTATVTLSIAEDSTPTVATPDLDGDGDTVWESALTDGSGQGGAGITTTTGGTLQIDTGGDALALIEVQGADGTWVAISADGTQVSGDYGTLTVNTDGSWSYTLDDNTLDHTTADAILGADQVQDLFGVRVSDDDGDVSPEATLTIDVNDDGPTVSANDTVLLDDDALSGGNPGGTGDDADEANTSGTLGHSFGADGAGSIAWLTSGAPAGFSYALNGSDLEISQNGEVKLTLTVNATTGAYTVTQNNPIEHVAGNDENNQAFTVAYQVTDGDGDTADGTIDINVDDDTPVDFTTSSADLIDGYTAALNFASAAGADGVGDVTFAQSLDGEPAVDSAGQSLYLDGKPLFYTVSADGHLLTASTEGGETGFTVMLNPDNDNYTVEVEGTILNGTLFEASVAGGIGGANEPFYLINTADDIEGNDVLVSSTTSETVNTSTGKIGIGGGQSITSNELARFDFLTGLELTNGDDAIWDDRLSVYGVEQSVNISGGQAGATFEIYAIATAGAASGEHPSSATNDTYLNLSADDIRIFNASGGDVTSSVTITDQGDGIQVEGVQSGWSYEVSTDQPFQAIEIVGGDGDDFKLGDMDFRTSGTATNFDINLDIVAEDGDGDTVPGGITLESPEPPVLEVGGNIVNTLSGNAGDDVIIGDTGGTYTVITPGESYNISLIVDSSGSMGDPSGTTGKSRMELAQDALKQLAAQLVNHDGVINLQIIDFDTGAISTVFTNISGDDLAAIETAINAMAAEGGTNYEAGFNAATDWFNGQTNGYINKALFLTDGDPTYYLDGNNDVAGPGNSTNQNVIDNSLVAFDALVAAGGNGTLVEAIGIGSGVNADILQFFDNTAVVGETRESGSSWSVTADAGEETIVNTADELNAALQGGSSADELAPVGDDILSGGEGDDILFGDTIAPVGQPGAGLAGVIALVKDANGGGEPTDQQIIDYLRANPDSYETPEGQGGDDTLNGGAGNDILYGGEGADTFVWNFGDQGTVADPAEDTVMDFTLGSFGVDADADKLDISDLLQGASDSTIDAYVFAEEDGNGNTLLHISSSGQLGSNGADADQTIVLNDVGMGSQSSADFLQSLIGNDQLDIE